MAGWFDAFLNVAGGLGQGLDRYAQMRQLRADKREAAEQRAFENQLRTRAADESAANAALQRQQLEGAILKQNQDMWLRGRAPGQQLSQASFDRGTELGLGDFMQEGGQPSPLQSAMLKQPAPGGMLALGDSPDQPASPIMDASQPINGPAYQLPRTPETANTFLGTFEQQEAQRKEQMQLMAALGLSNPTPQAIALARSQGMDVGINDLVQRPTGTTQQPTLQSMYAQAITSGNAEQQASILKAMQQMRDATTRPPAGAGGGAAGARPRDVKSADYLNNMFTSATQALANIRALAKPEIMGGQAASWSQIIDNADDSVMSMAKQKMVPQAFRNLYYANRQLKSVLGYGSLAEMRAASPTGGAVGNVSDYETRTLQSIDAALELDQDYNQYKYMADQVERSISRWQRAIALGNQDQSDPKVQQELAKLEAEAHADALHVQNSLTPGVGSPATSGRNTAVGPAAPGAAPKRSARDLINQARGAR